LIFFKHRNTRSAQAVSDVGCSLLAMSGQLLLFCAVSHFMHPALIGTIGTTVKGAIGFHTVTNNFAATMGASRRHRLNSALKTVKYMNRAVLMHFEALIIA